MAASHGNSMHPYVKAGSVICMSSGILLGSREPVACDCQEECQISVCLATRLRHSTEYGALAWLGCQACREGMTAPHLAQVAVRLRPLNARELAHGDTEAVTVSPEDQHALQVQLAWMMHCVIRAVSLPMPSPQQCTPYTYTLPDIQSTSLRADVRLVPVKDVCSAAFASALQPLRLTQSVRKTLIQGQCFDTA